MKFTTTLSAIALLILAPTFSWADRMGPNGDKLYEAAAHFEGACREKIICRAPYNRETLLDENFNGLSPEIQNTLFEVAQYQAQIWADTILEGDYVSAGDVRLDEVTAFYRGAELLGYNISYSETAWNISDCAYDGAPESLKSCTSGRIFETSYVSNDMQTFFSDEERFAQFLSLQ